MKRLEVWAESSGYARPISVDVPADDIVAAVAASAWRMAGEDVTVRTPGDHRIVARLALVWEET